VGVAGEINLGEGLLTKKQERLFGNIITNRKQGCLRNPGSLPKSMGQNNQDEIYLDIRRCGGIKSK
jgi:hypothetical protein